MGGRGAEQLGPVMDFEAAHGQAEVGAGGVIARTQPVGDFLDGKPEGQEVHDLDLPPGQADGGVDPGRDAVSRHRDLGRGRPKIGVGGGEFKLGKNLGFGGDQERTALPGIGEWRAARRSPSFGIWLWYKLSGPSPRLRSTTERSQGGM